MKLRITLISAAIVLVSITAGGVYWWQSRYQHLTLTDFANTKTVTLYASQSDDEDAIKYDHNAPLYSFATAGRYKLRKGYYIYVVTAISSSFQDETSAIDIDANEASAAIHLHPTQAILAQQTTAATPQVMAVLRAKYGPQLSLYTLTNAKLYEDESWYGARLVPVSPGLDALLVALQKKNSKWELASDPPAIILSKPVYPDIPQSVLTGLDSLQ